jgi:integrase
MFKVARRWRLVQRNLVDEVDVPRVEQPELNVLTEAEIARLLAAYRELEAEAAGPEPAEWWRLARRIVEVALATALRRGELLALRWADVELLGGPADGAAGVRARALRSAREPASRRTLELGPHAVGVLSEQYEESRYRGDDCLVFCHPALGTPLDPSRLSREYMRPALAQAGITKPLRPWHDLPHTSLTHEAAAGNPQAHVQLRRATRRARSPSGTHAAQVLFPAPPAAARSASSARVAKRVATSPPIAALVNESPAFAGLSQ